MISTMATAEEGCYGRTIDTGQPLKVSGWLRADDWHSVTRGAAALRLARVG